MNKILLKQKLHEKSILENKLLRIYKYKIKNDYMIRVLNYDLNLLKEEIKELQDK